MSIVSWIADAAMTVVNGYEQAKAATTLGTKGTPEEVLQQMLHRNNVATTTSVVKTLTQWWDGEIGRNEAIGDIGAKLLSNKLTAYMEENGHSPLVAKAAGWAASYVGGKILTGLAKGILGPDSTAEQSQQVLMANGSLPSREGMRSDPSFLEKIRDLITGGGDTVSAPYAGMNPAARGSQFVS